MTRYQFTEADRRKGGQNGSREDKVRAGQLGFEATCISHPFFARKWLQYQPGMKKSPGYQAVARQKVARQLIARTGEIGRRRPMR